MTRTRVGLGVIADTHGLLRPEAVEALRGSDLIVHAGDRQEAILRMRRALGEMVVEGVRTTIPFHQKLLAHPDFLGGRTSTQFVERLTEAA